MKTVTPLRFYIGLHMPAHAWRFDLVCMSVNVLRGRRKHCMIGFGDGRMMLDSGAFTEISKYGEYRHSPAVYAKEVNALSKITNMEVCVAQDYMCEPFILNKTGMFIVEHQRLTVRRYDDLLDAGVDVPVMPVIQGYEPDDYVRHIEDYGPRLTEGMWVGVGSVCKRNGKPEAIRAVLDAIHSTRPDLRIHGFGLKKTSIFDPAVRRRLYSADSMAWSFAARYEGRNQHSPAEAQRYKTQIDNVTGGALWPA